MAMLLYRSVPIYMKNPLKKSTMAWIGNHGNPWIGPDHGVSRAWDPQGPMDHRAVPI